MQLPANFVAGCFALLSLPVCAAAPGLDGGGKVPARTAYSAVFNATQTASESGDIETAASHKSIAGQGKLSWNLEGLASGEYLVIIEYASNSGPVPVEIVTGDATLRSTLAPTSGVYADSGHWYERSFMRRQLSGVLELPESPGKLELRSLGTAPDDTIVVYSLELLSTAQVANAEAEVRAAEAARPAADWFSDLRYGLMFHWTSQAAPRDGAIRDYATAVEKFDVDRFVRLVREAGAEYVIFTANHADPHFPAPLAEWERVHPGQTTERDLIAELAEAFAEADVALFLYFATHIYADLENADRQSFIDANIRLLTEVGERYGESIEGFWLDGWYQSAEKFADLPYEKVYRAAKAGHPDRLLALNSWLYPIVSPWQDYWAGEVYSIPVPPSDRIIQTGPGAGLRYHALLALEGDWVHTKEGTAIPAPVLNTDGLLDLFDASAGKGPVTLNVLIYQDGTISDASMAVLSRIRQHLAPGRR